MYPTPPSRPLTAREQTVIGLLATGLTIPQVAGALQISRHTARAHADEVRAKLGASTIAHAVAICYQHGILDSTLAA